MKRIIVGGAILALVAIGIGIFYLFSNLNSLVAQAIEDHGGKVSGTSVAVSGVDISIREGRAGMSGLTIASPREFDANPAIGLGEILVDIDIESLRGEPIVIEEILVKAPVLKAEILENGASNIMAINDHVQAFSSRFQGEGGGAEDQKRIRIKQFVLEKGHIEVDASALGLAPQSVDLPAIRLDDIGGSEGALPDEIAKAVLGTLTKKATAEIARSGIEAKARDAAEDEAEKQGKKLLDKIGG